MAEWNVIFDMDGVIFDTERAVLECWLETSKDYPIPEEEVVQTFLKCTGTNYRQTLDIYHTSFSKFLEKEERDRLFEESYGLFRERYTTQLLPVKPGVVEILTFLRENGIRTGLASSTDLKTVKRELADAELDEYFECLVGGDAVRISKPDPQIYLIACAKMQVEPSACFAVEDSFNGIRAAKAAGMRPVMVPDLIQPDEEIRSMCKTVCGDLFEAVGYLRTMI